jgi:hypothetical protein
MPGSKVLEIYSGRPFVVAYLPDSAFAGISEGDRVQVRSAGRRTIAIVEKILPMAEALPPEFQKPVLARESGQLVRVFLTDAQDFVTKQKVRITSCYMPDCASVATATKTVIAHLANGISEHYAAISRHVAQQIDALGTMMPEWMRKANAADSPTNPNPAHQLADKRG